MYNTIIDIFGTIALGGTIIFIWGYLTNKAIDKYWYKPNRKKVPMHDIDAKRDFSKRLAKSQRLFKLQIITFGLIVYTILTILTF